MWGKTVDEVKKLYFDRMPVTLDDILRLAEVQGQASDRYTSLIGIPFDQVPAMTECGDTHFNLQVPNQAASLPFITTIAGILIAAEIVKDHLNTKYGLNNWFEHNLLWIPKGKLHRFRRRLEYCEFHQSR